LAAPEEDSGAEERVAAVGSAQAAAQRHQAAKELRDAEDAWRVREPAMERLKPQLDGITAAADKNWQALLNLLYDEAGPRRNGECETESITFVMFSYNKPISVSYRFPRGALTLCPRLCMGITPGARFPARSADALSATLSRHFAQAIHQKSADCYARLVW
jgi:hypothetical protein